MKRLPLLPTWFLKQLDCSASKMRVLGDLVERFQKGESAAWYYRQSFFAIVAGAFHDLRSRKLLDLRPLFGAFLVGVCMEVFVSRYQSFVLDDTLVKGGNLTKWYAGVNWWASRQWKLGTGFGLGDLDKFNATGRTQMLITRLQWIY